jgi:TolB-like protein/Flp pilus assembly protein TadD
MSFFTELKRRNVFRVGIAYAVAAWVLLQVVDLVLENITAPDWVMQVFMLALAIGFPITLIMAWAFEMTPEGLKRETAVEPGQSITPQSGRKLDRVIIVLLALAVVFLIIDPFGDDQEGSQEGSGSISPEKLNLTPVQAVDKSVAVLPFAFRSNNPDDEFFAEGMHDDLLTQLAKIGSLKVISRTSVLEYKDTIKKIPQIAEELGVSTIVEGGVQRSGSRIRFNAQLIDAKTDEHLWAETYNRELTAENLFDIQAEIARAIAQALQATLSPEEEASINMALTNNLEAWESYQRAVRLRQTQAIAAMRMGISEIDHALELDPGFAAAWSLKAIFLLQQYWFYDTDPATRDAAWEAIQSGRAIEPMLPELDIAEGYYHYWGFRDYEKALPFMQRASAARPNDARAHQGRAYVLRRMGDWENTLAAMRRAAELDPRTVQNHSDIAETLSRLRRFEEAEQIFAVAKAGDPDNLSTLWRLGQLRLMAYGDVETFSKLSHFSSTLNPNVQLNSWSSSLYLDDFDAALQDVVDWQDGFLDTKDYRFTKPMLTGLTHLYAGDAESATPLLRDARQEFETLMQDKPGNYAINRSLCFITAGLGDLAGARQYCRQSLQTAPKDEYLAGAVKFNAAAGLALAGDAEASVELLKAMLDGGIGPTIYPVMYHPAFDGIRSDPIYTEFMQQYAPEEQP